MVDWWLINWWFIDDITDGKLMVNWWLITKLMVDWWLITVVDSLWWLMITVVTTLSDVMADGWEWLNGCAPQRWRRKDMASPWYAAQAQLSRQSKEVEEQRRRMLLPQSGPSLMGIPTARHPMVCFHWWSTILQVCLLWTMTAGRNSVFTRLPHFSKSSILKLILEQLQSSPKE